MAGHLKKKVLKILLSQGLLNEDMLKTIHAKEVGQRGILLKSKGEGGGRNNYVSIIDVISSLGLTLPGETQKIITEEMIMEAIARHLELSYFKIDPLKLDSDVVTRIIPRPFAVKHLLLPIKRTERELTIATANPFDREAIDWIERTTNYSVILVVSAKTDILKIITEFYGFRTSLDAAYKDIFNPVKE